MEEIFSHSSSSAHSISTSPAAAWGRRRESAKQKTEKSGLWRGLLFFVLWTTFTPYNGLSLPWLGTIHDFRGGGGCAKRGGEGEEGGGCPL